METYIQNYKIVASDMDITYHITPNAILQDCFANYLSSKRLAACDLTKEGLFWVISEFNLDFNGHVCNRIYLSIATATAPVQFISSHDPVHVNIRFIREAFFGQDLNCTVTRGPGKDNYAHLITGEDGAEICGIHSIWAPCPVRQDVAAVTRRASQQIESQR